jgi:hypothetical protein
MLHESKLYLKKLLNKNLFKARIWSNDKRDIRWWQKESYKSSYIVLGEAANSDWLNDCNSEMKK